MKQEPTAHLVFTTQSNLALRRMAQEIISLLTFLRKLVILSGPAKDEYGSYFPSAATIMSSNQEDKFISRNKSNEVEALQQHHNAHKFRFHSGLFQGERHSRVVFNQQPVHPLQSKPASSEELASPKTYQSRREKFYGLCIFLN